MASPAYLDWARYQNPSADSITSASNNATQHFTGPAVDCSAWKSVVVTFINQDAAVTLACGIAWLGYNGTFVAQTNDLFTVGPGQIAEMTLPVRGRTLSVFYDVQSGTATSGVIYDVTGLSAQPTKYNAARLKTVLVNDFSAYASNQLKQFFPNFWYEGKVLVTAGTDSGNLANVLMYYFDTNLNAYTQMGGIGALSISTAQPREMMFPPHPVRVDVGNGTTAQSIRITIMPLPD